MPVPRYELQGLLGEGGMGVVYCALDTRTNSLVALKTLRDVSDPATLEMFKREWEELRNLIHANIVDLRDVDEVEIDGVRRPCFIMPLLPGETLASLIKASSPRLTTEFVVNTIFQVCKGLQFAHEKSLIHRDLKPSNIFIMSDDTAKIIDFGLVHAAGNKSVSGLKGTWQYMSPEQIDGKPPTPSFDIYSLGVVAYEALTGHQPFKRGRFDDTVDAVRHFIPQAISERNSKVPQLVSKAIHLAMAKQAIRRYTSAKEFADTLQKAYNNQPIDRFDPAKIRPRIDRAKRAFSSGDSDFATEILSELEAEGNLDPEITLLRSQIDEFSRQKKVRQLFEAAQTRIEQDEIPLAQEKLEEILRIDPQNIDAQKMRRRIGDQLSQQQVASCLSLARQHLELHDFAEARRNLKEVFNLKYDEPEAAQLQDEIDAREKEVASARSEKEHLYSSAVRAQQSGEISSVLSKLEKIFEVSRGVPGASVPERDKVYQAFYSEMRIESDRVDNAFAEGTRHLAEKNFEKALEFCDSVLARYPKHQKFQALRLKIEHSRRQELSAYIAEIGRAADAEPNLDRRVALLDEASKRYPSEGQFSRQLSLARDLRELVDSIVNRARNYDEQSQFDEAIAQWNTVANVHPQYPGIDFEISQLERRREQQAETDKKSRLVQKIDRALDSSAYAEAERLSQEGLLEFPQNQELLALLKTSRQRMENAREQNRLFEQAKQHRENGDPDQGIALLRQALSLNKRNIVVQNTLVRWLVERSHTLLDKDWEAAERLAAEASQLDREHPSVNTILSLIGQAKKKDFVERTIVNARELQRTDLKQAINVLEQAIRHCPDIRLEQTLTGLQPKEQSIGFHASVLQNSGNNAEPATVIHPQPTSTYVPKTPAPPPPTGPAETKASTSGFAEQRTAFGPPVKKFTAMMGRHSRNIYGALLGLLAAGLLIALASWYSNQPKKKAPFAEPRLPTQVNVVIDTKPSGALVALNGKPSERNLKLTQNRSYQVTVSSPGYKTATTTRKATGDPWPFVLEPEPLHITVSLSEQTGSVWLDNQRAGDLADGDWSTDYPLKADGEEHLLNVKGRTSEIFRIKFKSAAGKLAVVDAVQTKDLVVACSLGKDATVYSGNRSSLLALDGKDRQPIPQAGLSVNLDEAPNGIGIVNGKQLSTLPIAEGNAPALSVSLNAAPNLATVIISATPKTATLLIEGEKQRPKKAGSWSWSIVPGSYKAKLIADGMMPEEFLIKVPKGGVFNKLFDLKVLKPTSAALEISGGTPGARVVLDDTAIGELDENGSGLFPSIIPGPHTIIFSKEGHASRTVYGKTFVAGVKLDLRGDNTLPLQTGNVTFKLTPGDASLAYRRAGETEWRPCDKNGIQLTPGAYQFQASAAKYKPSTFDVTVEAGKTKSIVRTLDSDVTLPPPPVITNADEAEQRDDKWITAKDSKAFLILRATSPKNSIVFLNDKPKSIWVKPKHMIWTVTIDEANKITYSLDAQGVGVTRILDGEKSTDKPVKINASNTDRSRSYFVTIYLEQHSVRITKRDGTVISTITDENHDWSRARIAVKGDTYFTVWLGQ